MPIHRITSIHDVSAEHWNALMGADYPFMRHEFLAALEDSKATTADSGWLPQHLLAYDDINDDQPIAMLPLFAKGHSYGEYVFDWSWADAYHRANLPYYPKLVSAVPFTPATGPRMGFAAHLNPEQRQRQLNEFTQYLQALAKAMEASSWHCLFPEQSLANQLAEQNFCLRQGCQFHWFNEDFTSFDDFLETFASRKRKNLKKERKKIVEQNLQLKRVEGHQLTEQDWQTFYDFYRTTYLKRSGHNGYLNQAFFLQLGQTLPEHLMMVQAFAEDRIVAAALFFKSSSHLYGRYWGALAEFDGLHFEACYYQGIEYAIEQKLQCFDPGAQGEHKIQRGFKPIATWSNHWLAEPQFHAAVADFVEREQPNVNAYMQEAETLLPFKQT